MLIYSWVKAFATSVKSWFIYMQLCEISLLMLNMLLNQQDWILCFLLSEKKKVAIVKPFSIEC